MLNLQKGTTLVRGAGSHITIRDYGKLVIGRNGTNTAGQTGAGTLMVKEGGAVVSHAALELTSQMSYSAYVVIDSGSSVTLHKGLSSKVGGAVDMKILNGGSLISKSSATFGKPNGDDGKPTTLLVDGDGSRWSHSNGEFKLHNKASLRLANRGALDLGGQTLHLAGKDSYLFIGGGPDDEAQAGGTLTAGQLAFASDAATANSQKLVFNHIPTEAGLEFAPVLSGKGNIEHKQGHTILSGHSEQFAGSTTVTGGMLVVTGKLGGTVDVKAGGALGGMGGTLSGKTTVHDGGTLHVASQGMAFNDDLTLHGALAVALPATPTAQPLLKVSGNAKLENTSQLTISMAGMRQAASSYLLLQANKLEGSFGAHQTVANNLAFLDTSLDYAEANTVRLALVRRAEASGAPKRFESEARSRNARSAARALDALPAQHALHQFVLTLPKGAPEPVFKALSGDAATAVSSALHQSAIAAVRRIPIERLRNTLQAGMRPGALLAQTGSAYPVSALPASASHPLWAQAFGAWQRDRADSNAPAGRATTGGLFIGADRPLAMGWRLGGALGYSHTHVSVAERSAKAGIDNYSLALYGGRQWQTGLGKLSLLLGASHTLHRIHSDRDLARIGLSDTLKARYKGSTSQLFTEIGHAFPLPQGYVEPYLGASFNHLHTDAYTEKGGMAALRGQTYNRSSLTTTLGLHAWRGFTVGGKDLHIRGGLAWRYTGQDLTPRARLAFQGGPAFTVQGLPIARSTAQAELGADLAVNRQATLGLGYAGEFASRSQQHTVTLNARWAF
ncbi:hypothetical protein BBN53_07320 [Bordetella pseudohinzii]|uniref:Autotransporter domain-containing protein n=10 Tax=Bordetella pseudohinzii TaxID=1331258 RepID=A0ABN4RNZ3_9BORD|nr:hypothetical protein BBN53_07320 [Bordetella pseudohinzii]